MHEGLKEFMKSEGGAAAIAAIGVAAGAVIGAGGMYFVQNDQQEFLQEMKDKDHQHALALAELEVQAQREQNRAALLQAATAVGEDVESIVALEFIMSFDHNDQVQNWAEQALTKRWQALKKRDDENAQNARDSLTQGKEARERQKTRDPLHLRTATKEKSCLKVGKNTRFEVIRESGRIEVEFVGPSETRMIGEGESVERMATSVCFTAVDSEAARYHLIVGNITDAQWMNQDKWHSN